MRFADAPERSIVGRVGMAMRFDQKKFPAESGPSGDSGSQRDGLLGLLLFLGVVLIYLPVRYAGFVWDDDLLITANPAIIGPLGLKEIWTTTAADICPLTVTTFWLEHALWGLAPAPYHVVNVIMHGLCALVLWRVLIALRVPGAWLGAALWAFHPVAVESVAWVAELKNPESALFFLLSILFFVKWLRSGECRARSGLVLLCAALAMACKTSTVILPVILCLCAWWMEARWRTMLFTLPVFVLSAIAGILSIGFEKGTVAELANAELARPWPERFAAAGDAIWFYLGKLLWPQPLIAVYPRWQIDAASLIAWLPLAAVIIVMVILWTLRNTALRPVFFVFAYFVIALLPVLGFIDNTIFQYSLVFDHFQYLASMGPLALIGAGLARGAEILLPGKRELQSGLCAALLFPLALLSWQRSAVYEDSDTLWTDTLGKNPDCWVGHYNLGNSLAKSGSFDDAIAHYQTTIRLHPDFFKVYNNYGIVLAQTGHPGEAVAQFEKSLQLAPDFDDARKNLALVKTMMAAPKSPPSK